MTKELNWSDELKLPYLTRHHSQAVTYLDSNREKLTVGAIRDTYPDGFVVYRLFAYVNSVTRAMSTDDARRACDDFASKHGLERGKLNREYLNTRGRREYFATLTA